MQRLSRPGSNSDVNLLACDRAGCLRIHPGRAIDFRATVRGQHKNGSGGQIGLQSLGCLQPVHDRHGQIQHDKFRQEFLGFADGIDNVGTDDIATVKADSTLALDADTGKIASYHQYTPHDSFDWDEVSAPLLIETEVDGKLTKTATHAGRNGYLWILDRDRLKFLHAYSFANNNVFTSIDPTTGRPTVDESKRPGAHQGGEFCPSIGGGKDWPPEAWSPQTKLLYIPANNNLCAFLPKGQVPDEDTKGIYVGYGIDDIFGSVRTGPGAKDHIGELQAWDLNTGKKVWQHNFKAHLWAPLLVTGGDVVFAGGTQDRQFRAFNARTGDQLWSFPLPSGAEGVPTTFEVDGEQYVAVTTGWDLDARGVQNGLDAINKTTTVVPQSGTVLVFKLQ
jgi:alcohol dehydrogenase (cytochrome c)